MRANLNGKNTGREHIDLPQGHRNLLRAVLVQAAVDAVRPPKIYEEHGSDICRQRIRTKNTRRRKDQAEAREWFLDERDNSRWPFTSAAICQVWDYPIRQWRDQLREGKVNIGNHTSPRD